MSNINQSLTYELPIAGGGTDFRRLCRIVCQQIVSKYKKIELFVFQERFRLLSLAAVLRKIHRDFKIQLTLSFEIAMSAF